MNYRHGDEIEVVVDRQGLSVDHGIGHLPDDTMVVITGAGDRVGESVQATVMSIAQTPLGSSVMAYVK